VGAGGWWGLQQHARAAGGCVVARCSRHRAGAARAQVLPPGMAVWLFGACPASRSLLPPAAALAAAPPCCAVCAPDARALPCNARCRWCHTSRSPASPVAPSSTPTPAWTTTPRSGCAPSASRAATSRRTTRASRSRTCPRSCTRRCVGVWVCGCVGVRARWDVPGMACGVAVVLLLRCVR
jgi:hypothetical protein